MGKISNPYFGELGVHNFFVGLVAAILLMVALIPVSILGWVLMFAGLPYIVTACIYLLFGASFYKWAVETAEDLI